MDLRAQIRRGTVPGVPRRAIGCDCCPASGESLNGTYPEIVDALAAQHTSRFVVDGEVVAFEGAAHQLRSPTGPPRITDPDQARSSKISVFYYIFDSCTSTGRHHCPTADLA